MKGLGGLFLLAASCGGPQDPEVGWRPLAGDPYVTPRHGLTFYWVGPGGAYSTPETAAAAIDALFIDWCQVYEARWGFGLTREQRRLQLIRIDIQLFSGGAVLGNSTDLDDRTLGIYWPWNHQIDAAMGAPMHWDAGLGMWSEGLQVLRHEWSHVFQGAYHP